MARVSAVGVASVMLFLFQPTLVKQFALLFSCITLKPFIYNTDDSPINPNSPDSPDYPPVKLISFVNIAITHVIFTQPC